MSKMDRDTLTTLAKEAEFFETDPWAVRSLLEKELLTPDVLDPCAGRGVLGVAARAAGYAVREWDIHAWPGQLAGARVEIGDSFIGALEGVRARAQASGLENGHFSVLMNPPFSHACEFVRRSLALGARKVVMFQRYAFLESGKRRAFFERTPPNRIWICGDRATCWRGDIPEQDVICPETGEVLIKGKQGRSAPTAHAWFVWERGHTSVLSTGHIWKMR